VRGQVLSMNRTDVETIVGSRLSVTFKMTTWPTGTAQLRVGQRNPGDGVPANMPRPGDLPRDCIMRLLCRPTFFMQNGNLVGA